MRTSMLPHYIQLKQEFVVVFSTSRTLKKSADFKWSAPSEKGMCGTAKAQIIMRIRHGSHCPLNESLDTIDSINGKQIPG